MSIDTSDFRRFSQRHIGPDDRETRQMLTEVGAGSIDEFIESVVPKAIRAQRPLNLEPPLGEDRALRTLSAIASKNHVYRSLVGIGYSDTITPPVIQRNILENPAWYTQYTPYQAEIAQGRLEALLNFQTLVIDLTGFEIANASLLDEATAAAEAMLMFFALKGRPSGGAFVVSNESHPQTIAVLKTRAKPLGINIMLCDHRTVEFSENIFGALLQYPASDGAVYDYRSFCMRAHAVGVLVVVAADLLALAILTPPADFGADVTVGNTQRFGVPLGFGGPHAAYFATKNEFRRQLPGRIIGVSMDSRGQPALRMALQTREQHIRREKATSNICTAQVLLAIMAGMYAVYHGPDGLKAIAVRIHGLTKVLASGLKQLGYKVLHEDFFDTLHVECDRQNMEYLESSLHSRRINLRWFENCSFGVSLDERSDHTEIELLLEILSHNRTKDFTFDDLAAREIPGYGGAMKRTTSFLTHPVFSEHRSETEMLRYIKSLEEKDLSLAFSMIPLGSCTMKLNATTELLPVSWPAFNAMHPFAPVDQAEGYHELFGQLESMLKEITGFAAVSLQPNSGAQGEYTGLLVIRAYHEARGEQHRNVCLIPSSAHGTNPASAVMAGMDVVVVRANDDGSIDIRDLELKAQQRKNNLAALMVTYPSTHGVFEEGIKEICRIVHVNGGQVYMDGANLNAQVGLCRPAELGADVCHINLHKTFCIPHGGGGPGMGPIGVAAHLVSFLPSHPVTPNGGKESIGSVSATAFGSASILVVSWAYIAMMGAEGLTEATRIAILNANYLMNRLEKYYPIVYKGMNGRCAHEFLLDLRAFKQSAGVEVEDVAKRLMDYGFHAPTTSFPVVGTLMIEPTESETKEELDRFCDAMIGIREEIAEIERGMADRENNVLKNAPHTADMVISDKWSFPYAREKAAYPAPWLRKRKFWTSVGRVDNPYGDRNLVCACPPIEHYDEFRISDR
ncbi:MAG TPA: aminomethyl-transferring glycine dehydrogenase [Bacteroidota bacterium]|jgi:glycine dehydrogenase|nr:aminomethyl-transferring glycine dehydrogenase [Bacteroidota bacterium]